MGLEKLDTILQRDGFILYICGAKEKGKTDFGLCLAEYCYLKKFRVKIATNIETESYMIEKHITNLPDLKEWLKEPNKKLFILDEAGLSIPKLRFMSSMNIEVMKILQMIRHYDAGFIGIAPSSKNIDTTFTDTDILDAYIKKLNKQTAVVKNYLEAPPKDTFKLIHIERTSINFNSKHISEFTMERPIVISELPEESQMAYYYARSGSYKTAGAIFNKDSTQARRIVLDYLKKRLLTVDIHHDGTVNHKESVGEAQSP